MEYRHLLLASIPTGNTQCRQSSCGGSKSETCFYGYSYDFQSNARHRQCASQLTRNRQRDSQCKKKQPLCHSASEHREPLTSEQHLEHRQKSNTQPFPAFSRGTTPAHKPAILCCTTRKTRNLTILQLPVQQSSSDKNKRLVDLLILIDYKHVGAIHLRRFPQGEGRCRLILAALLFEIDSLAAKHFFDH